MPPCPYTLDIFYLYLLQYDILQCMAVIVSPSSASTYLGYFYRLPPCHSFTLDFFFIFHECGKEIKPGLIMHLFGLVYVIASRWRHARTTP